MINYIVFITATGEIVTNISMLEEALLDTVTASVTAGRDYLAVAGNRNTQYVVTGVVTARPALSVVATWSATTIASGVTATLGTTLPVETVVTVVASGAVQLLGGRGHSVVFVNDGSFEFSSTIPGTYTVSVECFPYLNTTYTITVT